MGAMPRRAFTNPVNVDTAWQYVNTNPFSLSHFRPWIAMFGHDVKAVLVDTGVHSIFRDPSVSDYPAGFLQRYLTVIRSVAAILKLYAPQAELYYIVPDIPVDYPGRGYLYPWNVKRTVEYARLFLEYRKTLPGEAIAVVQGRQNDPWSTVAAYREHEDVYGEYSYLALGPTCTSRRVSLLAKQISLFDSVVHVRFHAFGVHSSVLSYMVRHRIPACKLVSIDTSSYYWDIHYRFGRGKTPKQKAEILRWRMKKVQNHLNNIPCTSNTLLAYIYGDSSSTF